MLCKTFRTKFHVKTKDIKNCSKFKIKSSECIFHKNKTKSDGLNSDRSVCRKDYYNVNQNPVTIYQKKGKQNREIRSFYIKNEKKKQILTSD